MATAETLIDRAELYIGGQWIAPAGAGTIDVINASTEEVMGRIPEGTPEDVDRAVAAAITPWNYPLHQVAAKVAPAITAGNTVVLKPSEVTPLSAFVLAEIFDEVGVPAGVFNLVTGFGPVVGEAIAAHPDVDMVSFTGSTRAGRRVSELASQAGKRVAL